MSELTNYKAPLLHCDNLESVQDCSPLCADYNTGLYSALLLAANSGKYNAIPLLATVFRSISLPYQIVLERLPSSCFFWHSVSESYLKRGWVCLSSWHSAGGC